MNLNKEVFTRRPKNKPNRNRCSEKRQKRIYARKSENQLDKKLNHSYKQRDGFGKKSAKNRLDALTKHHRKPRSLGGLDTKRNISLVFRYKHQAWHILFDSHTAPAMLELFLKFLNLFGTSERGTSHQNKSVLELIYSSRSLTLRQQAWDMLFRGLSIAKIIHEINDVWIDPDYELMVRTTRVKKVLRVVIEKK